MQFTLREIRRLRMPLLIWLAVTVVAGMAGPFGTLEVMGLGARTVYWAAVAGVSIVLNFGAMYLASGRGRAGAFLSGPCLSCWCLAAPMPSTVLSSVNGAGSRTGLILVVL